MTITEVNFHDFGAAVEKQFNFMAGRPLFRVDIDKDLLWDRYLASFPEGTNPIFRERTEHDCQCCKGFIRTMGGVVAIIDKKLVSIWDVDAPGFYQVVADAMASLVKSKEIDNVFLHVDKKVGTAKNYQVLEDGTTLTWEHFAVNLPQAFVVQGESLGTKLGTAKTTHGVFYRSLSEITPSALAIVQELIDQGSLYRGVEHEFAVKEFKSAKAMFDALPCNADRALLCWELLAGASRAVTNMRNTAIGTLLVDLSDGKALEQAVKAFETKVAPANYKRPTAVVTQSMIQKAQKAVEDLGYTAALARRYAVAEDLTINNVLFANREAKKQMNVFDELAAEASAQLKNLDKVEEVNIFTFLNSIVPKAESIELLLENRHEPNFVSLVAPVDPEAKGMFKWDNNFSWAYAGEVADSIKQRVKAAGGNVTGYLRCSLAWFNGDDLDLHLQEPNDGCHIYYGHRTCRSTGGNLDVDMNADKFNDKDPVENICYPSRHEMRAGDYQLYVKQFTKRDTRDPGFEVEIEFGGSVYTFTYPKAVRQGQRVNVARFRYTHEGGIEILESLPSTQATKEIWGLNTNQFHKVSMAMFSPNYWDANHTGNQHVFFMLENCQHSAKARGFFNEFLTEDLRDHRKVFEVLGSKMKTPESENQLSGLGFSTTQRNSVMARVKGSFSRVIKVTF